MSAVKDEELYLVHILERIDRIESYTRNGRKDFFTGTMVQDAVLRNLQVLAEATQRLCEALKAENPEVPWKSISGFRNVMANDYLGVDPEAVWGIIENDLPHLRPAIVSMLAILRSHPRS